MKGSKDLDFSLVSNKNLRKIPPSSGWAKGQITSRAKMTKNLLHLWCHPQKPKS